MIVTAQPSTFFARFLLDLPWEDSQFSLEQLEMAQSLDIQERWTPIHMAAALRNRTAIEWLSNKHVNVNDRASREETVFYTVLHGLDELHGFECKNLGSSTEAIRTLLKCKAEPHIPRGLGPYVLYGPSQIGGLKSHARIGRFQWYVPPGMETFSDLEDALTTQCSRDAAMLLFEDGATKVDSPEDWFLMALWTSVKYEHDLRDWLLEKFPEYVHSDTNLSQGGAPASKYMMRDSWRGANVDRRREFVAAIATRIGKNPKDFEEDWDLMSWVRRPSLRGSPDGRRDPLDPDYSIFTPAPLDTAGSSDKSHHANKAQATASNAVLGHQIPTEPGIRHRTREAVGSSDERHQVSRLRATRRERRADGTAAEGRHRRRKPTEVPERRARRHHRRPRVPDEEEVASESASEHASGHDT